MLDKPNGNWVKVSREVFYHELANDKPWSRLCVWIYLVAMASTGERTVQFRGHDYFLKRGQLTISQGDLEDRAGWSRERVRSFFRYLTQKGMIEVFTSRVCSVITVLNYGKWQGDCQAVIRQKNNQVNNHSNNQENDTLGEPIGCTNNLIHNQGNNTQNKKYQEVSLRIKEKYTDKDSVVTQKRMNTKVPLLTFDPPTQSVVGELEEAEQRFTAAFPKSDFKEVMEKMRVWIVKRGNPHKTYWKTLCTIASGNTNGEASMKKFSVGEIGKSNVDEGWG
jgi:hypothetical protein